MRLRCLRTTGFRQTLHFTSPQNIRKFKARAFFNPDLSETFKQAARLMKSDCTWLKISLLPNSFGVKPVRLWRARLVRVRLSVSLSCRFYYTGIAIEITKSTLFLLQNILCILVPLFVTNMSNSDYEPPSKAAKDGGTAVTTDEEDLFEKYRRSEKSFVEFSKSMYLVSSHRYVCWNMVDIPVMARRCLLGLRAKFAVCRRRASLLEALKVDSHYIQFIHYQQRSFIIALTLSMQTSLVCMLL